MKQSYDEKSKVEVRCLYDLSSVSDIKRILKKFDFSFSKGLGQNFLIDSNVCPRMADECIPSDEYGVLEIGPGIGVLTVELAQRARKVISVELDKRLLPILDETLSDFPNVEIINQDILKCDIKKIVEEKFIDMPFVVCANLPYYITSDVIMKLLEERVAAENITVMVQKEAANRICANPGTREVGAISIAVRYYSDPRVLFEVPKDSFVPVPNVDSAVIQLLLREQNFDFINDDKMFFKVVKAAFAQRRKMLSNTLSKNLKISKEKILQVINECGLAENVRVEQLVLKDFANISEKIKKL